MHFNRRDLRIRFPRHLTHPWFSEIQKKGEGFDRPRYHVTRATAGLATTVKPGDTIWLIGQLYAPWGEHLPATLDARIDVASVQVLQGRRRVRYAAAETSRWYPLTNATEYLQSLRRLTPSKQATPLWKNWMSPIGQYLQQMRQLELDEQLWEWEKSLSKKSRHFISYRIRDGSRAAFNCARSLLRKDVAIFWDRWSLPRRLAERREVVGDQPLDDTIEQNIRQADVVWGIETPLYNEEESYAARERRLAVELGKYRAFTVTN